MGLAPIRCPRVEKALHPATDGGKPHPYLWVPLLNSPDNASQVDYVAPFLIFNGLPTFAFPGVDDRLLDSGHGQRFGKARFSLLAGDDGVQEVVGFDHLQVVVAQIQSPGRIEVAVVRMSRPAQESGVAILRWVFIVAPLKLEFIHALHVPLDGASGPVNFKGHITFGPIDDPARFQHPACAVCKMHQGADVILVGHLSHRAIAAADIVMGEVTNEDYVSALVHFANGTRGMLESCRVINGAKCDMSFEVHGTRGAIKWNMERMNELQLQWRNDENPAEDGYTTLLSGPAHPYHGHFNPAWGLNLGYDDLKVIEVYNFLHSVVTGQQGEPGF